MGLTFKVDLTGKKTLAEAAEQEGVSEGYHLAELVDIEESTDSKYAYLHFKVVHGKCEGQRTKFTLPDPDYVPRDKLKKAQERVRCIMTRLGLISEDELGGEAEVTILDAKGEKVFIHVELQEGRDFAGISYLGIYDLAYNPMPSDFPPELNQFRTCANPEIRKAKGSGGNAKSKPKQVAPAEAEPDVADLIA